MVAVLHDFRCYAADLEPGSGLTGRGAARGPDAPTISAPADDSVARGASTTHRPDGPAPGCNVGLRCHAHAGGAIAAQKVLAHRRCEARGDGAEVVVEGVRREVGRGLLGFSVLPGSRHEVLQQGLGLVSLQGGVQLQGRPQRDLDLHGACPRGAPHRRGLRAEVRPRGRLRHCDFRQQLWRQLHPVVGVSPRGRVGSGQFQVAHLRRRDEGNRDDAGREKGSRPVALHEPIHGGAVVLVGRRGLLHDLVLQRRVLRRELHELRIVHLLPEVALLLRLPIGETAEVVERHCARRWAYAAQHQSRRQPGRLARHKLVLLLRRELGRPSATAILEHGEGACRQHQKQRRRHHAVRRPRLVRRLADGQGRVGLLLQHRRIPAYLEDGRQEGHMEEARLHC
mmetsp:Transcript_74061/g.207894  ORF Transcript_74061/g.207894 Transcript_74061/m.207894 type:complete len:397 (+) Transcript_74061:341-1531(+)